MLSRNDSIEEEIGQLVERLEELSVEQKLVTKKLKRLRGELKGRRASSRVRKPSPTTINSTIKHNFRHSWYSDISGAAYTKGNAPEEEDIVRIVNTSKGQARLGKIIGFCKDGKVKVDTDQGSPIIRAPHNVMLVDREDEASSFY